MDWGGLSGYCGDLDGDPWEVAFNPHFPIAEDGAILIPSGRMGVRGAR